MIKQLILILILSFASTNTIDRGGNIFEYLTYIQNADIRNTQIRIKGWCISACTMKLGAKDVCIYPDATLFFHEAYDAKTRIRSELGTQLMFDVYPIKIQEWVTEHKALENKTLTSLSGSSAIELGITECK